MKCLYIYLPAFLRKYVSFETRMEVEGIADADIQGIDTRDYPDFCDAFLASAVWKLTGDELTEDECIQFQDWYPERINELVFDRLY